MKRNLSLVFITLAVLTGANLAAAKDSFIRLKGPLAQTINNVLPVAETGAALYEAQEGAHAAVTATTGVAIPHDYINIDICTEDECVPIDPFRVRN